MGMSVGFIGGGRIVRIILKGWMQAGYWPGKVVVSDTEPKSLETLRAACPEAFTVPGDNLQPAEQDVVFLALHPPGLKSALGDLRGRVSAASIVVSLAPKLTIEDIAGALGGASKIARVIPNAPSIVGAGFNPICFGPALSSTDRGVLLNLLAPLGAAPEVAERDLEAYALLTGMGPTCLWFELYEMLALAEEFGLERAAATKALAEMARGTVRTMTDSHLSPAEVMDLVPVRPLAEEEEAWKAIYRTRFRAIENRIRPAAKA
ncbi:MAG: NAD(P)-binding domain-containing protein [Vicinamibacteria bacterium]|nr:NAD(P)-binding domain-containing protein [Vicinamibacteria bacterium]MBP9945044.1 NAD(P)-binding domain-containing protein [Vicinamibacteria bacterium]